MKKRLMTVACALLICLSITGCRSSDYDTAVTAAQNGNYLEAIQLFASLGDYKDSKEQLLSVIDEYADSLVAKDKYRDAISLYQEYTDVSDFSQKISDLKDEKMRFDTYSEAISEFISGSYSAGFELLDNLPESYRNVKTIRDSYNSLKNCPFKGSHINRDGINNIYQKIQFELTFDEYSEEFVLHAYKAVYLSDGSVFADYDYHLDTSDINGNTIELYKFTWVVGADGSITETENGETHKYN